MESMKRYLGFSITFFLVILLIGGCASQTTNKVTPETGKDDGAEQSEYPTKTVKIIVGYAAGGANDILARLLAKYAEDHLGQSIVVENKTGGGGAVGFSETFSSEPDGYTIGMVPTQSMIFSTLLRDSVYEYDEFKPIINQDESSNVLVMTTKSSEEKGITSLEEFISYAKENPGQLKIGTGEKTGRTHITSTILENLAEIDLSIVPFGGSAETSTALRGEKVDAIIHAIADVKPMIEEGVAVPIAIAKDERSELIPDIPTFKEEGVDLVSNTNRGYSAPPNTPDHIISIIHDAFKKAMEDPEYIKELENLDFESKYLSTDEYIEFIEEEYNMLHQEMKSTGIIE